ncbi:MAG: membrane protein insertion efficiency factor YidD [Verrucomicrobia bacterium]|nr:membrane protein insertion efficiency factor YidD [Verrucomicrobiota bacterium]
MSSTTSTRASLNGSLSGSLSSKLSLQSQKIFSKLLRFFAIFLIKFYRLCISPCLGSCCRFTPSCSQYALEAFQKKSFFHALWLTIKRLLKCHPWHKGGEDAIP